MDKVYLIFWGEYSDRMCIGFCTTKEEAIRYCAIKNGNTIGKGYNPDYEYEEQECLDGKLVGSVNIGYSFNVMFKQCKTGWEIMSISDGVVSAEHRPVFSAPSYRMGLTVWTKEDDKDKAKKIACDELYRYVYEQTERDRDFAEMLKKYIQL